MPTPSSIPPDDLLDRYFIGALDEGHSREVRAYLENDARRRGVIHGILDSARGDDIAERPNADDAYVRLSARLDQLEQENSSRRVKTSPTGVFRGVGWRIGVAAAFCFGGIILATNAWQRLTRERPVLTYVTSGGAQASVTLADGSRVTLAPYSQITMRRTSETTRHLTLSGEAYFDVISSKREPVVVQTGSITTRVLGTAFSVRHYDNDPNVRVVVTEGKVESANASSKVVLTAGDIAHLTDSTTITTHDDAELYTSWTKGRLTFANVEVRQMLAEVGRWYGYEFRLEDSTLATRHVKTTLLLTDRAETLRAIKELLNVTMTFDGTVVTLDRNHQHTPRTTQERHRTLDTFPTAKEVGR